LVYWEHMSEQYTQKIFPGGTACTLYDANITDLWDSGGPASHLNGTDFLEYLHRDRLQAILEAFLRDSSSQPPLFLLYTPHVAHYPLQVPKPWLDRYTSFMGDDEGACNATVPYIYPGSPNDAPLHCRAQGAALMGLLDEIVGNATGAIKAAGAWDETLVIFQSDNGAPLDTAEAGGGNFPLRGGKYSSWQGGVQTPAFVSGGFLPYSRRGQREAGLLHIADWWSTLIGIAGGTDTSDERAAAHGLPPPDSLDLWPLLSGEVSSSPRVEVPIAPSSIISYPWKFLKGPQWWSGWQGPVYPNASSPKDSPNIWEFCGEGCLFNLEEDPGESVNLAAQHPQLAHNLSLRIDLLAKSFFSNNDTSGVDLCPAGEPLCGCWAAVNIWGGFLGPYQK